MSLFLNSYLFGWQNIEGNCPPPPPCPPVPTAMPNQNTQLSRLHVVGMWFESIEKYTLGISPDTTANVHLQES